MKHKLVLAVVVVVNRLTTNSIYDSCQRIKNDLVSSKKWLKHMACMIIAELAFVYGINQSFFEEQDWKFHSFLPSRPAPLCFFPRGVRCQGLSHRVCLVFYVCVSFTMLILVGLSKSRLFNVWTAERKRRSCRQDSKMNGFANMWLTVARQTQYVYQGHSATTVIMNMDASEPALVLSSRDAQ